MFLEASYFLERKVSMSDYELAVIILMSIRLLIDVFEDKK